ncbi:VOC family protein [Azospirillum palustre]
MMARKRKQNSVDYQIDHVFISPNDWEKSRSFFEEVLRFELNGHWGDLDAGRGASFKAGNNFHVVIAEHHESTSDHSKTDGYNGVRPTIYLKVNDVDIWFSELKNTNSVLVKPEDTHWGIRWVILSDPDGNIWAIFSEK